MKPGKSKQSKKRGRVERILSRVKKSKVIRSENHSFVRDVSTRMRQKESKRVIFSEMQEWMKGPSISVADAKSEFKIQS